MSNPGFTPVPEFEPNDGEHRRKIARSVNLLMQGKMNVTLGVTLKTSATSTTIIDHRIGFYTFVSLMPTTAHAAAELASGNLFFDTFKSGAGVAGSCVVHHTNNAQTDRTFLALFIG